MRGQRDYSQGSDYVFVPKRFLDLLGIYLAFAFNIITTQQIRNKMLKSIVNTELLMKFISSETLSPSFEAYLMTWRYPPYVKMENMTVEEIEEKCLKINSTQCGKGEETENQAQSLLLEWKKGELKLFFWLLAFYCFSKDLQVHQLDQKSFQFFQTIFLRLNIRQLRYQVKCWYPQQIELKRTWTSEEDDLFSSIMKKRDQLNKKIDWKPIAFELYIFSEELFFRMGPHCRQRWMNHLNPNVKKGKWSQQEDIKLLECVISQGERWALIKREFKGTRTQHMIKNRQRSLIHKWKKMNKKISSKVPVETISLKILDLIKGQGLNVSSSEGEILQSSGSYQNAQIVKTQIEKVEHQMQRMEVEGTPQTMKYSIQLDKRQCEGIHEDIGSEVGLKKIEEVHNFLTMDFFEMGISYKNDPQLRNTIDDVTEKLGFSHFEQVDMFFDLGSSSSLDNFDKQ